MWIIIPFLSIAQKLHKITYFHEQIWIENSSYPVIQKVFKNFCCYIRMENLNYKDKNINKKYFKNIQKNQFLKANNSFLELEKKFTELKDRELKDKKEKVEEK